MHGNTISTLVDILQGRKMLTKISVSLLAAPLMVDTHVTLLRPLPVESWKCPKNRFDLLLVSSQADGFGYGQEILMPIPENLVWLEVAPRPTQMSMD